MTNLLRGSHHEKRLVAGTLALFFMVCASTYGQNNAVPLINDPLVPASTTPGGPDFSLTVNGTGFVSLSVVNWNGSALPTKFVSGSQLTATVPAAKIASSSTALVTVVSPSPGGGVSNVVFFGVSSPVSIPGFTNLPPNPLPLGVGTMITADFNGDGKLDLAYVFSTGTSNGFATAGNSVVIQLGNGDGSFRAPVSYDVGNAPGPLIAADFNGDGKLDLVIGNYFDNNISVLLGNGDGTFESQVTFPTPGGPVSIVAGDFNQDGKLDLAVGNGAVNVPGGTGGVSILLGNGDGTFQSAVNYNTSYQPAVLVLGDFNSDGKLDIVYFGPTSTTATFLQGNGDGTFQSHGIALALTAFEDMVAGDFNGDGKLDLAAVTIGQGLSIFLGNGDGTFQSQVSYLAHAQSYTLAVGDLNADGELDLVVGDANDPTLPGLNMLLGKGNGTFQAIQNPPSFSTPNLPVLGDFNGDGKMDIAGVNSPPSGNPSVTIFLQGQFPAALITPNALAFGQQAIGTSSSPQTITLTNSGTANMTISGVTITGTNATDFTQSSTCASALAVNANCQINVTFTPTALGSAFALVSIADNSPGSPQLVSISGTTPPAPTAVLSASSFTFPSQYVGTSGLPQTVTVTNSGTAPLNITKVSTSPSDFGVLNACGSNLASGSSCSIGVFFDPAASGARSGTLTITDNASDSPQVVTLSGTGQDFSLATTSSPTATITSGQTANYTLGVAPGGGFNQTVALTCSGAPALSTCTVSPSSVSLNGASSTSVSATITTTAPTRGTLPYPPFGSSITRKELAAALILFLGVVAVISLLVLNQRPRYARRTAILATILLFAAMLASCGGGNGGGGGSPGTQSGTYTVSVSATFTSSSATLKHAINLTLVVQ